ncbi:glutamate-ammonia-ligase adenylyltransferase [Palleronia marisminoris]|uniref:Glutamate-ammonia-ligase adenylyltransferase n=1 Tax=Palleronia marisminoris TaxID=315423 RepID=A0A1Y5RFG3_9RHOB|nr:glutamine-synthetase adenylyltransferase [Palleronia marisminoris]SFG16266.1 glutamate-ammonia-ligase adenylyltransferase [Palleronia marisminoris]SLN16054.1 Glutamate-ammonia-ligase adenylyltransferase [Palleronia marisminoris]
MSFATRITRAPDPFDRDRADEALSLLGELPDTLRDLVAGVAGCSPYLQRLIEAEADWLREALDSEPETALHEILSEANTAEAADLGEALRRAKRRVALLVALCDCGGVWSLGDVTGALTRLADLATDRAWRREIDAEMKRGRLPDTESDAGGFVALAMGKMGAFELNYSSDIDLICLFDEDAYATDDVHAARSALVKATQRASRLLTETTGGGYVFRTDLRLRPDPGVTPVCLGMAAALRYYESLGRTWERAAHIKARPCAGDVRAGERYLEELRPFVWRRHLDFAAIRDAHDMRLRIRDHRGLGGPIRLEGHDMKLGRGGIREIEFFTQTLQIIAGGRDAGLRVRGTVEGLGHLSAAGWVDDDTAQQLAMDYAAHREVEHRIQMIADQQTHLLPDDAEGFARLAAFVGRPEADLRRDIVERLERVSDLTETFFAPSEPAATGPELTEEQAALVEGWRGVPALRSERALDIFDRIKPILLKRLLAGPRPDLALVHFDGFIRGLPAGVQLFSLFEANPELLTLIADIAGTTTELSAYLSRNAGVLDGVLGGHFFTDWPGEDELARELSRHLAAETDYERQLDAARSWARDWHFRTGVHHLRGLIDGAEAGRQYTDLADAVIRALWPAVIAEFGGKHGPPPGRGAMVLGMGSLGARHLTARSDLDLIVIYDAAGEDQSEGRRPLPARTYYARLTQALVTALSAPTAAGKLYEVDMRLRPSGKQGPVATALSAFEAYQSDQAWTWEHLALTRARGIAGGAALIEDVEAVRRAVIRGDHDRSQIVADARTMLDRLAEAKPGGPWDMKAGPGHMTEIELAAQAMGLLACSDARAPLAQLDAGLERGLLPEETAANLRRAYLLFSRVQDVKRLLVGDAFDPADLGAAGEEMLLRETGSEAIGALSDRIGNEADAAAQAVREVLDGEG